MNWYSTLQQGMARRRLRRLVFFCLATLLMNGAGLAEQARPAGKPWLGVHLMLQNDKQARLLQEELPTLASLGLNTLVLELNYSFEFQSHSELRTTTFLSREEARSLAQACRKAGIRPIPQFNCLGHQSWSETTFPLLTKYPELDETPDQFPRNKGIYCRSWCPQHPRINPIVFALMDEIIEAFAADAFHVGMDEVFLIASEHCPRCRGGDPAKLFAKAVNDYQEHLVKKRGVEMLMWGDRFLDGQATGYGRWEASLNGTSPALDLIPKDVVLCDWHYGKRDRYPSIPLFLEKGFRVWPAGWDKSDATEALVDFALQHKSNQRLLGHLATTWGKAKIGQVAEFAPLKVALKKWAAAAP
jgi:hypothetical protein